MPSLTATKSGGTKKKEKGHVRETKLALGHFRDMIKGKKMGKSRKGVDPTTSTNSNTAEATGAAQDVPTGVSPEVPPPPSRVTFDLAAVEDDEKRLEGNDGNGVSVHQSRSRQRPNRTKQVSDDTMISAMCAEDLVDDGWDEDQDNCHEPAAGGGSGDNDLDKIAALADLSFSTCLQSGDNRRQIVESGALRVCLFAMQSNPDNPSVLAEACRFLGNLMDDDGDAHLASPADVRDGQIVSLTKTIVHRGGVEAVVEAMAAHPAHADLQDSGCFALSRLLDSLPSGRGTLARAGGIEAVVAAMAGHPTEPEIQLDGCAALHLLVDRGITASGSSGSRRSVQRNEHYRRLVVRAGGLEAIAAVLRHFPDDPELHDDATAATRALWPRGPPGSSAVLVPLGSDRNNYNNNGVLVIEPC